MPIHARARAFLESVAKRQILITYQELANALQILPPHSIHRVTEALERLMVEEDAAADRPFIAALAISSKERGTSLKPYTLLTAFDHPHILIGKSEMVTNFMHQNMSNNRIQRDLTSSPKIEDRISIEKNHIWQVSGRRILCLKLGATVKCTQNTLLITKEGRELWGNKFTREFFGAERKRAFPTEELAHHNMFGFKEVKKSITRVPVLNRLTIK